jgi:hypothetical protein
MQWSSIVPLEKLPHASWPDSKSLVQPGLLLRYELELNALLEFLVWQFSVWVDRPTPGNALMNLRYRDERAFASLLAAGNGLFLNPADYILGDFSWWSWLIETLPVHLLKKGKLRSCV